MCVYQCIPTCTTLQIPLKNIGFFDEEQDENRRSISPEMQVILPGHSGQVVVKWENSQNVAHAFPFWKVNIQCSFH